MLGTILAQLYSTQIELLRLSRLLTDDKDLEILILRQQLDVMTRTPSNHKGAQGHRIPLGVTQVDGQ